MCNSEKENNYQGRAVRRQLEAGTRAACAIQPTDPTQELGYRISVYYQITGGLKRRGVNTPKNCLNIPRWAWGI